MKVCIQVIMGIIIGWLLFYVMGLEQEELFKFVYQYINSTVFYFSVVVGVLVICFTVLRKFKVFGVAVAVTMVGVFMVVYVALNTGSIGF
ncbi:hypothetical protein [Neobacillus sp. SAB-20_R2A]|uniref:hypothetical protein n=1 Tax=Neobacillus sp. SAB-20_R2A TaxID=3120519 RepID=UPI003C6E5259